MGDEATIVEEFGAYRKAMILFDHVVNDMHQIRRSVGLKLVSQQIGSADSIAANNRDPRLR